MVAAGPVVVLRACCLGGMGALGTRAARGFRLGPHSVPMHAATSTLVACAPQAAAHDPTEAMSSSPAPSPSFAGLDMAPELTAAVARMGLERPTWIQEKGFRAIRHASEPDVVLAGETGIGKTLAYLLPVADTLLSSARTRAGADGGGRDSGAADGCAGSGKPDPGVVLVVQPNADLCFQARRVAERLLEGTGLRAVSLADGAETCGAETGHVLIGTPTKVLAAAHLDRVRFAVFDEADSLLAGSFKPAARQKYPVEQLLQELRREMRARGKDADLSGERPRPLQHILVGATVPNYGERNVRKRMRALFPEAVWVESPGLHRAKGQCEVAFYSVRDSFSGSGGGGGTPAPELADGMPRDRALVAAVAAMPGARTLVFASTAAVAEHAVSVLHDSGVAAAAFHKNVPVPERQLILNDFAVGSLRCLVSTGLAARGLDLPGVAHVVEYSMAQNVVEHLHRIGRTARAGLSGQATCLYGPADHDLVAAIRRGHESGRGIEQALSRNRSFRQRVKRGKLPQA